MEYYSTIKKKGLLAHTTSEDSENNCIIKYKEARQKNPIQ